jgi:hypothetical protein
VRAGGEGSHGGVLRIGEEDSGAGEGGEGEQQTAGDEEAVRTNRLLQRLGFIGTIALSGLLGAFGVSFLFVLWTHLFEPGLFNDGQYMMVFLVFFPLGWLVGSGVGTAMAWASKTVAKPLNSLVINAYLVVGGAMMVGVPGMIFMMLFFTFVGLISSLGR